MKASDIIESCRLNSIDLCEYMLEREQIQSGISRDDIFKRFGEMLDVMTSSAEAALNSPITSVSNLTGGDAHRYNAYVGTDNSILGDIPASALAYALSCSEINASMGRIVACPTAGACGIVPGAVLSVARGRNLSRDMQLRALIVAGAVGIIIGENATLSGADGGCQAECGSAAAMAAAAVVYMLGGDCEACFHGSAIAIKNVLGLVCDPVAGLVEVPCIKRNSSGVVNALSSADMALAGIKSNIPFDEVVDAMRSVGNALPAKLKETAEGGLADTATGRKLKELIK